LDRIVSKEHAQIIRQPDGQFLYHDLDSLNGSFMNEQRISDHLLVEGDQIALGDTILVFRDASWRSPPVVPPRVAPTMPQAPRTGVATTSAAQARMTKTAQVAQPVTIHSAKSDTTFIQQTVRTSAEFLPEHELQDVETLRADYEKLRLAHELGRSIGLSVDIDALLEKILMKSFELIPADRGVILLMESDGPKPKVWRTRDGRNDEIALSQTILDEVKLHKNAVLSSDATADIRFQGSHSVIMQGIRSTMTVPLIHVDQLLGIMHLDSMIATNAFGEKDLQIFASIGNQAAAAIHNSMLARKIEQDAKTRDQFQHLLSPNLVDQVVAGKLQLEKGGKLTDATLLFSDIRGFTAMSERSAPEEIFRMLNEYFERMVNVIFEHHGTLDKFVGDEIVALFGAPVALDGAESKAVACALGMKAALADLNRKRKARGDEEIGIGVGINTGTVVTGAIGSERVFQYTAIGDAVNIASRLCSGAQAGEILVSESTYERVQAKVCATALAPMRVKGKTEPLRVWNVTEMR